MRIRLGVTFWLLSWVPYGIILGLSGAWYSLAWAFEFGLGFVGIALAGSEFATAVKAKGWKRAPGVAWNALVHGRSVESAA